MRCVGLWNCAGIFKQSMGARNRIGTGWSYRPARLDSQLGGIGSLESILKSLKIRALVYSVYSTISVSMMETTRRRITVTSSFKEISTD